MGEKRYWEMDDRLNGRRMKTVQIFSVQRSVLFTDLLTLNMDNVGAHLCGRGLV